MLPDISRTLGGREALPALLDDIESGLTARGVPAAAIAAVNVALDEVVTNAFGHGGATRVEVAARVAEGRVTVDVGDDGPAFDPTCAPEPDTAASVEHRHVGGLGIHMVMKLMDEVAYERRPGRNHLRLSKTIGL
ncbi:ATP-binding protein [Phenylobacterium sp.]|uniref:ATP-binding protein n=1 Tax=Phenylobacterium sp. TaxID=1871053 RepID=UPI0025ED3DFD|nr:ATP-binding protein [Phenylobacterium sp.]MBX3486267.1 ATP-binding protein [Phenylobacterium sp.]